MIPNSDIKSWQPGWNILTEDAVTHQVPVQCKVEKNKGQSKIKAVLRGECEQAEIPRIPTKPTAPPAPSAVSVIPQGYSTSAFSGC